MFRQMPQIEGFRLFRNGISILDKGVFLIQINIGKVCTLYRSAGRCQFAGNQFQQGCLTAAVIPFNAQSAAAAQLKAEGSRPKVCVAVRVMKIDIPCRNEYFACMQCRGVEVCFQLVGSR